MDAQWSGKEGEITLAMIEGAAQRFAEDRAALAEAVLELNAKLEELKRRALPRIKFAVATAAESQGQLSGLVDRGRHLFVQPRTVIFHGIKVGLRKGAGGIEWDDEAKVVELIEKLFPRAQAELLVKTTKRPIRKALEDLDVATLKKLGCRVEETGDEVVIKAVDGEVEKVVKALLKEALEEETNGTN